MKYSKSTNGFYTESIHGKNVPLDSIEITDEQHQELIISQSQGKIISTDKSGNPVAIDPPDPTQDQIFSSFESATKTMIDAFCKTWGYDSILSAASYSTSKNLQYANESDALTNWRDAVWTSYINLVASVKSGLTPIPTSIESFLSTLPAKPARP
jgi:hypothetical protein